MRCKRVFGKDRLTRPLVRYNSGAMRISLAQFEHDRELLRERFAPTRLVASRAVPATSNQQPGTSNQQPGTNNQEPATSNQQPAA
jgi:hypothetical protein